MGLRQLSCVRTSKSPKRVIQTAYLIGRLALPLYRHHCSPKKFTQPQLFACLALKEFLQLDYRKLAALLNDCPELCATIELHVVPHYTTFQKAAQRLLRSRPAGRLLDKTIRLAKVQGRIKTKIPLAAGDGTGWESRHVSHYYVRRRASCSKFWQKTTYARFPKAGILCDCASHLILAIVPGRGPGPDIKHFRPLLDQALRRVRIAAAALDAGYDAEHTHQYARHQRGVAHADPAADRPSNEQASQRLLAAADGPAAAPHALLPKVASRNRQQHAQATDGIRLEARSYWSQCRETLLRAITHNVMILRRLHVFYGADITDLRLCGGGRGRAA